MSESDPSGIRDAVRKVRELMIDVSSLLKEAQGIMMRAGWRQRSNDGMALLGGGFSLNTAHKWIPYGAFVFFGREGAETLIPCISVLLDQESEGEILTEPLVSGLVLRFQESNELPKGPALYSAADFHLHAPGRTDDGRVIRYSRQLNGKAACTVNIESFAVPLMDIKGRADVEQRIADPLLDIVR